MNGEFWAWVVTAVIYAVPVILIGLFVAKIINRNKEPADHAKWPIYAGLVLALVVFLGKCSSIYVNDGGSAKLDISQTDRGSANGILVTQIDQAGQQQLTDETVRLLRSAPAAANVSLKGRTSPYAISGRNILKTSVWSGTTLVALRYLEVRSNRFVVTACLREDLSELIDRDRYFCEKRIIEGATAGGNVNG